MIRTKEQLIAALANGNMLYGHMGDRPSSPWKYEIDGKVVHGNAVRCVEKLGLLKTIRRHWSHCAYVAKSPRELAMTAQAS